MSYWNSQVGAFTENITFRQCCMTPFPDFCVICFSGIVHIVLTEKLEYEWFSGKSGLSPTAFISTITFVRPVWTVDDAIAPFLWRNTASGTTLHLVLWTHWKYKHIKGNRDICDLGCLNKSQGLLFLVHYWHTGSVTQQNSFMPT